MLFSLQPVSVFSTAVACDNQSLMVAQLIISVMSCKWAAVGLQSIVGQCPMDMYRMQIL